MDMNWVKFSVRLLGLLLLGQILSACFNSGSDSLIIDSAAFVDDIKLATDQQGNVLMISQNVALDNLECKPLFCNAQSVTDHFLASRIYNFDSATYSSSGRVVNRAGTTVIDTLFEDMNDYLSTPFRWFEAGLAADGVALVAWDGEYSQLAIEGSPQMNWPLSQQLPDGGYGFSQLSKHPFDLAMSSTGDAMYLWQDASNHLRAWLYDASSAIWSNAITADLITALDLNLTGTNDIGFAMDNGSITIATTSANSSGVSWGNLDYAFESANNYFTYGTASNPSLLGVDQAADYRMVIYSYSDKLYGRYFDGSNWVFLTSISDTLPQAVPGASYESEYALKLAQDGSAFFIYKSVNTLYVSRFTPVGGWEEPVQLGLGSHADLSVNASGDAIIVWGFDGNKIQSMRYNSGLGWGGVKTLSTNTTLVDSGPKVVIDNQGRAFAAWVEYRNEANYGYGTRLNHYDFQQPKLSLTVNGNGRVDATSGFSCASGDCTRQYPAATVVTLTATADTGSTFTGWSGDCVEILSVSDQASVTMNADAQCTANFITSSIPQDTYTLSVTILGGPGAGSVTSSEMPLHKLDCINSNEVSTTCSASFDTASVVDLIPTPFSNNTLLTWSGCDEDWGSDGCHLTMDRDRSVTLQFAAPPPLATRTLTVDVTGSGTVSLRNSGNLSCSGGNVGSCSASIVEGSSVIIDASANASQNVVSWGGDCGPGSFTSTLLEMTADKRCSVTFTGPSANEYTLCSPVINETGSTVAGSVLHSVTGRLSDDFNPAANCAYYPQNTRVTLTPQAASGFAFYRWNGLASCFTNLLRDADVNQSVIDVDTTLDMSCTAVFRDDVNYVSITGNMSATRSVISMQPSGSGGFNQMGGVNCTENCIEPVMISTNGGAVWLQASDVAIYSGCDVIIDDPNRTPGICYIQFPVSSVGQTRNITVGFQ